MGKRGPSKKEREREERKERIELLKGLGRGLLEIFKTPVAGYALTSLGILALGKLKIISPEVTGTLQGVTTFIAISQQVEEGGDGFFGLGGGLELAAKGGTATLIGVLWGAQAAGEDPKQVEDENMEELKRKFIENTKAARERLGLKGPFGGLIAG